MPSTTTALSVAKKADQEVKSPVQVNWSPFQIALIATLLSGILLGASADRIDFHADEAIYMSAIPLSVRTDSGLCFSLPYLATAAGAPTPLSARWTSILFGLVLIFSTTRTLQLLNPRRATLTGWLLPLATAASFHGIFAIVRVRPEISWFAIAAVIIWCLVELRHQDRLSFRIMLLGALLVLPMNHMLCLFACFFIGIWFVVFGPKRFGILFSVGAISTMGLGLVLNTAIRSYLISGELQLFPSLGTGASGAGMQTTLTSFLHFMYWISPLFLCDQATTENWWQRLFPDANSTTTLHAVVGMRAWAIVLITPLMMRSKESFFVAAVPLLTAILFYCSNYYNATYMPLIGIYAICVFVFLLTRRKSLAIERVLATCILLITLLNGLSFLTTRVFNHGPATYFAAEQRLREEVAKFPPGSKIAVAERFQPAVDGVKYDRYILFKDKLPEDLDCLLLDNYDFEMYRFVPTYETLREQVDRYVSSYDVQTTFRNSVYRNESVFEDALEDHPDKTLQGAWFFRHSVNYRVSVLVSVPISYQIARSIKEDKSTGKRR